MSAERADQLAALADAIDEIWQVARRLGLDPCPVHFEVVPSEIMYEFGAYGLPGRFSHWTCGKAYHQLKTLYDYGLAKIYELVVNTSPAYAFLLDSNSLLQNKLVVAHVLAHVDFFRHNVYFRDTNRRMIETASSHADRIRRYEFEQGPLAVERYLDAALSIQDHVDPTLFPRGQDRSRAPARRQRSPARTTPYDDLLGFDAPVAAPPTAAPRRVPAEPAADLLLFLLEQAPDLEEWQRELLAIVREEALYFLPQLQTRITNEGWATYWHGRILRELPLSDAEALEFASLNAALLTPSRPSLNPYLVGLRVLEAIRRRWDEPTADERERLGRPGGEGEAKLFEVRDLESDASLLRNYLTPGLVEELDLYLYRKEGKEWKVVERGWEVVRDRVAGELATRGHPQVVVEDGDYLRNRELYLRHVYEGRELDGRYAERTLEQVYLLWGRPVHLQTVRGGKRTLLSYDGTKHQVATPPS